MPEPAVARPDLGRPELATLERAELAGELAHWRAAARALTDLDGVASPAAWAALESYLGLRLRDTLTTAVLGVVEAAGRVQHALAVPADLPDLRRAVAGVRARYLRAEMVVDFYGDAVNTRTSPRTGALLRGLDALAVDSMEKVLGPLGIEVPPVLCYRDGGAGASILRWNAILWDASPAPVAAVKITHHNTRRPTSLVHETGHQVAHLTGWNPELGEALAAVLAPVDRDVADVWRGWAGEVAADVYAFALLGWAPLPALATVVGGSGSRVFRMVPGDPHPFGWIRVQFGAALCRSWFGPGPWDDLARVWAARHPPAEAPPDAMAVVRASLPRLADLADACTRTPMRAFGGRPLSALADPRRVSPAELARLAERSGPALWTSSYLRRLESLRILAWGVLRDAGPPAPGVPDVPTWITHLGTERAAA